MEPTPANLLQGTLDLLILKALSLGEMHGLGVSRRVLIRWSHLGMNDGVKRRCHGTGFWYTEGMGPGKALKRLCFDGVLLPFGINEE